MVAQLLHGVALLFVVIIISWMENLVQKGGGGGRSREEEEEFTAADNVGTRTQKRLSGVSGSVLKCPSCGKSVRLKKM
jgi:hypothetical protein